MKRLTLFCLGLLMVFTAGAAPSIPTDDANVLRIDSLSVKGNMMDMMTQHLLVYGRNTSDQDFNGLLFLVEDVGNGQYKNKGTLSLSVNAGGSFSEVIGFELHEGEHNLRLAADEYGNSLLSEPFHITIGPLRQLRLTVEFFPEMMRTVDGVNILQGYSLRGKIKLTNEDNVPYYGISPVMSHGVGVMYRFTGESVDFLTSHSLHFLINNLEPGESVYCDFNFVYDFKEGETYVLEVTYTQPYDLVKIGELRFSFHAGTNTYWTANGEVKPLTVYEKKPGTTGAGLELQVPSEAVAVDLRGLYYMDKTYSINVSQANPNCLYYLDFIDNVPQGMNVNCNLVRDGEASVIRLTDNYDFYCPKAFVAQYISYRLKPNTEYGAYAETLVLPFRPQGAYIEGLNTRVEGLHGELLKVFEFSGYDAVSDTLNIHEINVSQMEAYKPYIVAVSASSPVSFYAEHATVPVTETALTCTNNLYFIGGTVFQNPIGYLPYRYTPELGVFCKRTVDDQLPPFRAWFNLVTHDPDEPADYLVINTGFDIGSHDVGIKDATDRNPAISNAVYSLSGMRQRSGRLEKGLYIVGGKKRSVR